MAKKNKQQQAQQALSPEKFIREKARLIPIYKCYMDSDISGGEANIIVIRKHKNEKYTVAVYLVDFFCCGVKDSFYRLRMDESDFEEIMDKYVYSRDMKEVEYAEAHNRIFGAVEFAEEAGIEPDKSFNLTEYLLEEDDDRVPLIEYEFGHNGHHCLITHTRLEASRYLPTLRKNLGENFEYHIEEEDLERYEDEDDEDDDVEYLGYEESQEMQYTYPGGDYPEKIELENAKIDPLMRKMEGQFTQEDIDWLRSLPKDSLCRDLKNLILLELHRQWGKYEDDLEADPNCNEYVIGNSIIILSEMCDVDDYLPVLLEVMRQNYSSFEFNFNDWSDLILKPAVYICAKQDPRLFVPYMLEAGLANSYKCQVIESLASLAYYEPVYRDTVIDIYRQLLEAYTPDLPNRTIGDGSCVGFIADMCLSLHAKQLLPLLRKAYDTGLVDLLWCGDYKTVESQMEEEQGSVFKMTFDVLKRLNGYKQVHSV